MSSITNNKFNRFKVGDTVLVFSPALRGVVGTIEEVPDDPKDHLYRGYFEESTFTMFYDYEAYPVDLNITEDQIQALKSIVTSNKLV